MKPEIHRVGVLDHEYSLVAHGDANSGSALYKVCVTLIETFAGRWYRVCSLLHYTLM